MAISYASSRRPEDVHTSTIKSPSNHLRVVFQNLDLFPYDDFLSSDPMKLVMFGKVMKSEDAGITPAT